MCGIFCYLSKNNHHPPTEKIKIGSELLAHRGSSNHGSYSNNQIWMTSHNLSSVNQPNVKQPISFSNNRYLILFDGKIYNQFALQHSLKRSKLETNSAPEILLGLYHEMGKLMVHRLRGMFAFIIWDSLNQKLFAARDHFGIKPLFYLDTEQQLILASEQKALLPFTTTSLNTDTLHHYLTFQYPPEPQTMHKQIYKIPRGSYLNLNISHNDNNQDTKADTTLTRYYQPLLSAEKCNDNVNQLCQKIRNTLETSVKLHMQDKVSVGAFLSSGIDSTILVLLAQKIDPNIKTFSIGFHEQEYNEAKYAQATAEELNITHHIETVTAEDVMVDLPKIVWYLDDPLADPAAIPLFYLSKNASQHVDAILSGEGADELFGGYNIYREPLDLSLLNKLPIAVKSLLFYLSKIFPENIKGKNFLNRGLQTIETRYYGNARIYRPEEKQRIYKKYHPNLHHSNITKPFYQESQSWHDIEKMQYIDLNTWLPGDILVKADRMTMANNLEARTPFLDKQVFNLAKKIPWNLKVTNNTTKYILRKAFEFELPNAVVHRKKLGFPVPIRYWLKNSMYPWAEQIIRESNTDYLFNKDEILKLLALHKKGINDYSRKIWTIITFMIWHEIYVEGKTIKKSPE